LRGKLWQQQRLSLGNRVATEPDAFFQIHLNSGTGPLSDAEQSAKIFKSVGAGFERLGTGAIAEVVLINQILVDTSGTQANLELSAQSRAAIAKIEAPAVRFSLENDRAHQSKLQQGSCGASIDLPWPSLILGRFFVL